MSELIYAICDLVSEALCADLAYSKQQPELALQMHVELHRALSREVSLRYDVVTANAQDTEVERSVWTRLTQLLLVKPGDALNTHEASSFECTDTALSEEEIEVLDKLLYRLESDSARDTKTLLNHYRVRWEQLLIARHSARILRAFDQRFDELIGRADDEAPHQPLCEVELAHLMMMIDDKIGAVMQSGYLKGALEIYRYISKRLDDHERLSSAGADFDPSAVASVLHMLIDQLRVLATDSDQRRITSSTDVIVQLDQMRSAVHQFIESAIPYCSD